MGATFLPDGLAFDNAGNLWVASADNTTPLVVELTASQLAAGGAPTPAVLIGGPELSEPAGLAFDRGGNLWVGNIQNSTIVEYSTSQLAATGSPTPAVTLFANGNSIAGPRALAFDSAGNLWATHTGTTDSSGVVEFATSQLVVTGSPVPAVQVNQPTGLGFAECVAFDASGNLWLSNEPPSHVSPFILEFAASQIAASGTPTPTTTITAPAEARSIAFNPHSASLPLH